MVLAIDQIISADGGSNQASVTTASFTPPNGSLLVIRGSCYAASGDSTSHNTVSTSIGGDPPTKIVERTKNQDGAGINPPPITCWILQIGTGVSMTVTTTAPAGTTGFAHVCNVYVITGHDATTPVVDSDEESTVVGMAISLTTPVADCLLIGFLSDWGNTSDVPDGDANTTTDYAIANADIQSSWAGHRFVGAAGTYTIGTDTLASPAGTSAIAIAIQPATGGEITETVNRVVETSTATPVNEKKTKLINRVVETSTANVILDRQSLHRVIETNTARPIVEVKSKILGRVIETDLSRPISVLKTHSINQVIETSVASAITEIKKLTINRATETDTARPLTNPKTIVVNKVTETNTSRQVTARKIASINRIVETQTATSVSVKKTETVSQVIETDVANSVSNPSSAIGRVTEVSIARSITVKKTETVAQVIETSTASSVSITKKLTVNRTTEVNTANSVVRFVMPVVNQVVETNFAATISGGTAAEDTHGWRPVIGNHCIYLLQKTFDGNPSYIKRRSVKITGFATDGYPILECRQDGTVYGTASVGIRPRSHPDADEFDVYVSY